MNDMQIMLIEDNKKNNVLNPVSVARKGRAGKAKVLAEIVEIYGRRRQG
jgi:hypothetical protein